MGVFGIDFFAQDAPGQPTYFGPSVTVINTFSTGPLLVTTPQQQFPGMDLFHTLQVFWQRPTTGIDLRLVRNSFNIPDDEGDGDTVYTGEIHGNPSYVDSIGTASQSGKFVYYSLFVSDPDGLWHRGGDGIGLLPADWSYSDRLYDLVPQFYRDRDASLIDSLSPDVTEGPLRRYLRVVGFALDTMRTEYETLRLVNDPKSASGGLLPLMAQQLGTRYESEMGMRQNRKLIENIVHLLKIKGTRPGIEGISATLTGWGAEVSIGTNFMLNPQNLTFGVTPGVSVAIGEFPITFSPLTGWPKPTSAPLVLTVSMANYPTGAYYINTGDPAAVLNFSSLGDGTSSQFGIPVEAGGHISFSIYAWAAEVNGMDISVQFYDEFGVALSTSAASSNTLTATTWVRAHINNVAVPIGAKWAEMLMGTTGVVNAEKPIYLSLPQIEYAAAPTTYEPPRDIRINLLADRVNMVTNPSFESGLSTGWHRGANTDPFVVTTDHASVGTHALRVISTAAGAITAYTDYMTALEEGLYIARLDVRADTIPQLVIVSIHFFDMASTLLLTVSSNPVMDTVTEFTPISVAMDPRAPAPIGTVKAYVSVQYLNTNAAGEGHLVDAVMFERAISVRPYFDASPSTAIPANNDYVWGGTADLSESFLYKRRAQKKARLALALSGVDPLIAGQAVPDIENGFVPAGMTYTLLDAQPV